MEVTLEQLQSSLLDVSSGVYNGREFDLFQAIESAKPQLLNLLDLGPKSATERGAARDGMFQSSRDNIVALFHVYAR
jgi:hypothetical protein